MSSCVLSTQSISKSYLFKGQKTTILKDISFCIADEEFACIVGSSGCGKSTLLEILAGITIPDEGDVYLQGSVITAKSGFLGYMPQNDLLFPWLTIMENAMLSPILRKSDKIAAKAQINYLADEFGLKDYLDYLPWQLSGGMKQRAAFLRTCMTGAKIMLLDEPFANLDALTRFSFQNWLKDIRKHLILTIIMVTHDLEEAFRLADSIFVLSKAPGKIEFSLSRSLDRYNDINQKEHFRNLIINKLLV